MKNHQILTSEVKFNGRDAVVDNMTQGEMEENIKYQLANGLVNSIIKDARFGRVVCCRDPISLSTVYNLSIAVCSPRVYSRLEDLVHKLKGVEIVKDGETILIGDLLEDLL